MSEISTIWSISQNTSYKTFVSITGNMDVTEIIYDPMIKVPLCRGGWQLPTELQDLTASCSYPDWQFNITGSKWDCP